MMGIQWRLDRSWIVIVRLSCRLYFRVVMYNHIPTHIYTSNPSRRRVVPSFILCFMLLSLGTCHLLTSKTTYIWYLISYRNSSVKKWTKGKQRIINNTGKCPSNLKSLTEISYFGYFASMRCLYVTSLFKNREWLGVLLHQTQNGGKGCGGKIICTRGGKEIGVAAPLP